MSDKPTNVIDALSAVSREVDAIEKARQSGKDGGPKYAYRGIEDLLNALHDPLVRYGVVIVPRVVSGQVVERPNIGKNGSYEAQMLVEYDIYGPGGREDKITMSAFATGIDTGDKNTGKAMSYAYKTAIFQLLCIPTDAAEDNEATTQAPTERPPARTAEPAEAWDEDRWKALAKVLRGLPDAIREAAAAALVGKGLFREEDGKRFPNTPFTDAQLDAIDNVLNPSRSDHAVLLLAEVLGCDDPIDSPPEGVEITEDMWALAEIEDADLIDWAAQAKAFHMKQADLLDRAQSIAKEINELEPDRLKEIHGQTAVELRNWLLTGGEPF